MQKEGYFEASKQYEAQIADLQENQNNTIHEIVNSSATIRARKKN